MWALPSDCLSRLLGHGSHLFDAQMVGLPEYYMTSLRVSNQNHKNKLSKTKQIAIHGHKNDMTSTIISMGPLAQSALLPPVSKGSQSDSPTCAEKKGFQKRKTWTFYWSLMRFEMIQKLVFTVFTTKNTQNKRLTLMKCWLLVGRYPKWQNESLILLSLLDHQNVHA